MVSKDVSIVIVSFNTRMMTLRCLKALFNDTSGLEFEVIVLDNNSSDGSADSIESDFTQVKLIRSKNNIGFGAGNNQAAKQASGKYILLLNPDTMVKNNAIKKLYEFAQINPKAGAWGGVCILPDGSIDPGCRQVMPTLVRKFKNLFSLMNREVEKFNRDEKFSGCVDVLSGAFMMLPMDLWKQLGGFDKSFKLYSEETDLCRRIKDAGYQIMMTGASRILHDTGSGDPNDPMRAIYMARGSVHFFRKHYSGFAALGAASMTWLNGFERLTGGYLLAPFVSEKKSKALRRKFSLLVFKPNLWWNGWKGFEL